jgi:hypothetical protein
VIYKTLNEIEGELRDRRFLRCHQSFWSHGLHPAGGQAVCW